MEIIAIKDTCVNQICLFVCYNNIDMRDRKENTITACPTMNVLFILPSMFWQKLEYGLIKRMLVPHRWINMPQDKRNNFVLCLSGSIRTA